MSASVAPPQLVGSLMDESGLACDKSGNLSKPNSLSATTTASTATNKRSSNKQQPPQQADTARQASQLLLEAEAAKRAKVITLNENVDQLRADREVALQRQLDDEDRAFTLPHIRGALPSESIAFLKWKGGRDGQPMWQAWMTGMDELTACRRHYRALKRRMAEQREQLLQLRVAEEERRAVRRASDEGVEVMDEDEYERYVQLAQAQKAYMADETERVAAKQQLSGWLARMSELQVDICESFLTWYDGKYAHGKPRQPTDSTIDRRPRWWEVQSATQDGGSTAMAAVEEQKVADESVAVEARLRDGQEEDKFAMAAVGADVQLNLSGVSGGVSGSGSKPGSSASAQKKEAGMTSRSSKVSRVTTSRT